MDSVHLVLQKAESELADVEQRLEQMAALQRRRNELRQWIDLTKQLFNAANAQVNEVGHGATTPKVAIALRDFFETDSRAAGQGSSSSNREPPLKVRVIAAAVEVYKERGPLKTRDLLPLVEAKGVTISGADKANSLASILSKSPLFHNDKIAGGWVYAGDADAEESPLA